MCISTLFKSNTEYLADRFSTNWTEPRHLAEALIKIAYGIVSAPDEGRSKDLLRSTRHLGIVDVKNAKHIGVVSYITHENPDRISDVMVFDRVNPWATIIELNSTHPLTGNRLDHLSDISREKKQTFPYDIDKAVERMKPDYGRLYGRFFTDLFVYLVFPARRIYLSCLLFCHRRFRTPVFSPKFSINILAARPKNPPCSMKCATLTFHPFVARP